jgi:uncharacterized membrane protein
MDKGRLEAFTDGVIAVIITILVLELKVPEGATLGALQAGAPVFAAYALSFMNVAIFWNNHHHMLHATERVNGAVLWANMLLLFWMSLVPFSIRWVDETHFAAAPTALYGVVLGMTAIAYWVLERAIIRCDGAGSKLARAVGTDRKTKFSLLIYFAAVPLAFVRPWIAIGLYVVIAGIWLVPDRRIEGLEDQQDALGRSD